MVQWSLEHGKAIVIACGIADAFNSSQSPVQADTATRQDRTMKKRNAELDQAREPVPPLISEEELDERSRQLDLAITALRSKVKATEGAAWYIYRAKSGQ
jgi:hypothetical protein